MSWTSSRRHVSTLHGLPCSMPQLLCNQSHSQHNDVIWPWLKIVRGIYAVFLYKLQAEKIMIDSEENKEYLPIQGLEAFNKATADLLLGQGHSATKVSAQSGASCPLFSGHVWHPAQGKAPRQPAHMIHVPDLRCRTCIASRHVSFSSHPAAFQD